MEVFVKTNTDLGKLKKAKQGFAEVVADLEKLPDGRNAKKSNNTDLHPRTKTEEGVLCQADNDQEKWQCRGRFVWGLSSDGTKALLAGYVPAHERGHDKDEYKKLKKAAGQITDADFINTIKVPSSADIRRTEEETKQARLAARPRQVDWEADLKRAHKDWHNTFQDEPEAAKEGFEASVRDCLKNNPEITDPNTGAMINSEMRKLQSNLDKLKKDPNATEEDKKAYEDFKKDMEEIQGKIKQEAKDKQIQKQAESNSTEEKVDDNKTRPSLLQDLAKMEEETRQVQNINQTPEIKTKSAEEEEKIKVQQQQQQLHALRDGR